MVPFVVLFLERMYIGTVDRLARGWSHCVVVSCEIWASLGKCEQRSSLVSTVDCCLLRATRGEIEGRMFFTFVPVRCMVESLLVLGTAKRFLR